MMKDSKSQGSPGMLRQNGPRREGEKRSDAPASAPASSPHSGLVVAMTKAPKDCTDHCGYGACDCSGEWQPTAYTAASVDGLLEQLEAAHQALRAYHAIFTAWEGRDGITLNEEALRQWKSIAESVLS